MGKIGYVYILTNPSFREDWVKIGKTSRPVQDRVDELFTTAIPQPFDIYATIKTKKFEKVEKLMHHYIERFTNLRVNDKREFFQIRPEVALEIMKEIAEVIDDAEIEEVHKNAMLGGGTPEQKDSCTSKTENRVWLIPSSSKFFDLEGCFKKYGEVYWTQRYNFKKGDTGYIYSALPDSAIKYKFEVLESELKYSPDMDFDQEFHTTPVDFEESKKHNRFVRLKFTGKTSSDRLTFAHLLNKGLNGALRGAITLSHPDYKNLKEYIETYF